MFTGVIMFSKLYLTQSDVNYLYFVQTHAEIYHRLQVGTSPPERFADFEFNRNTFNVVGYGVRTGKS
jgi:hypothetical protein